MISECLTINIFGRPTTFPLALVWSGKGARQVICFSGILKRHLIGKFLVKIILFLMV